MRHLTIGYNFVFSPANNLCSQNIPMFCYTIKYEFKIDPILFNFTEL